MTEKCTKILKMEI